MKSTARVLVTISVMLAWPASAFDYTEIRGYGTFSRRGVFVSVEGDKEGCTIAPSWVQHNEKEGGTVLETERSNAAILRAKFGRSPPTTCLDHMTVRIETPQAAVLISSDLLITADDLDNFVPPSPDYSWHYTPQRVVVAFDVIRTLHVPDLEQGQLHRNWVGLGLNEIASAMLTLGGNDD